MFGESPDYSHLHVFGCLCFPNLSATAKNKLSPRSTPCLFLGYKCLNLHTCKIITSRHVIFDEFSFPYKQHKDTPLISPAPKDPPEPLIDVVPQNPISPTSYANPDTAPVSRPITRRVSSPLSPVTTSASKARSGTALSSPSPVSAPSLVPLLADTHNEPTSVHCSIQPSPPRHIHTCSKSGIFKPQEIFNLSTSTTISPIPTNYRSALKDPNWHNAMLDEFNALIKNNTCPLVPCPADANVVTGKWIFQHKLNSDGSLARYKARWMVRGFTQQPGVDYGDTFSPVIKPTTIRVVLSIVVSSSWPIHQLDVKNAFLHGKLAETVFAQQPSGFVEPSNPNLVCQLNKSLYGLKQAPRTWFLQFKSFLTTIGFHTSKANSSLFIYKSGSHIAYLLLYVDDIILTCNSQKLLDSIIAKTWQSLCNDWSRSPSALSRHICPEN